MNKIHTIIEAVLAIAVIVLFIIFFSGKSRNTKAPVMQGTEKSGTLPVAYVRMDSLTAQYEYYQAVTEKLQKQAEEHRIQLSSKATALQKAAQDFERRMRTNAFISAEAQQKEQNRLLQMQQSGQQMEIELSQKFATQQQLMLEDVQKTIREQVADFNKSHNYALILSNIGLENILYGQEAMDITDELIKYLNERYKAENTAAVSPQEKAGK